MFSTFFSFEIKNWLRAPMPWIFMFVFGLLSFFGSISDDVQIGGSYGNVLKNAPYVAQNWYSVFSILGLLLITAFLNSAALRDFENNTAQIVFSSPIRKAGYYFGHFFGALLIAMIPMAGVSLGMWAGVALNSVFEWLPAERYGAFEITGHINAYLVFVIPNMIFSGGILYTVAILTRSTTQSFIAGVVLLVGYLVAGNLMKDMNNESIAAMLDPLGIRCFSILTKYWTVDDKNHLSLGLSNPTMLANRLIWMGVGLAVLIAGYFRFNFSEKNKAGKKGKALPVEAEGFGLQQLGALPKVAPVSGRSIVWAQLWSQFRTDFLGVVKSAPFIILSIVGLLNTLPNFFSATQSYGTHNLPVTYDMVDLIRGAFFLFVYSIMAYFTGALIWKERNARVNEIYDALPTQNWTGYVAKFATIIAIISILICTTIGAGMLAQTLNGYHHYELGVYVQELLVYDLLGFAFLTALFMLVHTLSPNMYLGFFISIMLVAVNAFVWDPLDISSNMVKFGGTPSYIYSDFYHYAPYRQALTWFNTYWALFSSLLAVATICFWLRGKESGWRKRLSLGLQEWKNYRVAGLALLGLWIVTAGFVFYNTKVLNKSVSSDKQYNLTARYEKDYKRFEHAPQPRIYDVKYDIRIFPESRSVEADGQYWVRNQHSRPIDTLFVSTPARYLQFSLQNERLALLLNDSAVNVQLFRIQPALAPGDSMLLKFTTVYRPKGFENQLEVSQIVQNGTFFNNTEISPNFGYQPGGELEDKNKRRERGLPEKSRRPALNPADTLHRMDSYLTNDADWVNVETTISTSADQLAIAPGSLVREWTAGGRHCFHYKLDHKSWNFYAFMSAQYEVAREEKGGIQYEVYYHKDHAVNVPRMMRSMQKSIEYYTEHFGPYYHKQCRIIEFPRVASFAQAFPGTMPYSESIGFIENYQAEKDDIDMVYYVVAHEMGHQYWAHQASGANMQGAEMTTETFAQYSALMVMEHEYGRDIMRKFLEYEMDKYLRDRGRERLKELPLGKCEGQGYIHYRKGSHVMYYLKEMIGEEKVNLALRKYLERFRYAEAPFPTSVDVVNEFSAQTPDSLKYIIQDLFWDITLFENKTKEASIKDLGNGKYEVTIQVECRKLKADELGKETEVPVNDWIEIGAFAKPEGDKKYGKTLYRQKVKVSQKDNTFKFVVEEKPEKAGIDPFHILIDREPEDNDKEIK